MRRFLPGCLLAATLGLVPHLAASRTLEMTPGPDFVGLQIKVDEVGGDILVLAGAREFDGKVAVCGLVSFEDASSTLRAMEPELTARITYTLAGKRLSFPTAVFYRYRSHDDAKTGNAGCAVTATPWTAALEKADFAMNLARGTVSD
jgi:hypothetical protein